MTIEIGHELAGLLVQLSGLIVFVIVVWVIWR